MTKPVGPWKVRAVISLVCLVVLVACGSGSGAKKGPSLSGNWEMSLLRTGTTVVRQQSGFFLQSGTSLSGEFILTGNTACPGVGVAQGQVDGVNLALTLGQTGYAVSLTGTAASDGSSINGNYSILTAGCGNSSVGTWTAGRVTPLNANFQAEFTPDNPAKSVFHFDGTVTQGANTGGSQAILSGNMTSTDARCFSQATISGLISGTSVVFNLLTADGIAVGQMRGTACIFEDGTASQCTPDANTPGTMTGRYTFLSAHSDVLQATCDGGELGGISVMLQMTN
jgi:hypothetical protein